MKNVRSVLYNYMAVLFTALFCTIAFASCRKSAPGARPGSYMVLSLSIPAAEPKALTDTEENHVGHVYVLLFDKLTGGFVETAEGKQIQNVGTSNYKQFRVELPYGEFDLMVLANCKKEVDAAAFSEGASRTQVVNGLKFAMPDAWGYTASTFTLFPMWGELEDVTIDKTSDLSGTLIDMYRMTAKISVAVKPELYYGVNPPYTQDASKLLSSVRLYNRYTQGQIIPSDENYFIHNDEVVIGAPSIPAGAGMSSRPLTYVLERPGLSMMDTIYTFEALKGTHMLMDNTCLVIGMGEQSEHTGGSNNVVAPGSRAGAADSTWYYRIDFTQDGDGTTFLPLLRNHHYVVTVTDVLTHGFPDPEQAFRSEHYQLAYEVLPWEEYVWKYGGDSYRLDISSTFLSAYYGGLTQEVEITTTHPDGWTFALSEHPDRIEGMPSLFASVIAGQNPAPPHTTVKLTVNFVPLTRGGTDPGGDPDPGGMLGGNPGYIHITSGNLTNVIKAQRY